MKVGKYEYVIYIVIICIIWILILLKYSFLPDSEIKNEDEELPLTDALFNEVQKKLNNIPKDTVVYFYYKLVNIGSNDLKIGYINSDCSCTECYAEDSIVMPKDTTTIVMKFDTKNKLGFYKLNTVIKLNTLTSLYKIGAMVEVVERDTL